MCKSKSLSKWNISIISSLGTATTTPKLNGRSMAKATISLLSIPISFAAASWQTCVLPKLCQAAIHQSQTLVNFPAITLTYKSRQSNIHNHLLVVFFFNIGHAFTKLFIWNSIFNNSIPFILGTNYVYEDFLFLSQRRVFTRRKLISMNRWETIFPKVITLCKLDLSELI